MSNREKELSLDEERIQFLEINKIVPDDIEYGFSHEMPLYSQY